MDDIDTTTWRAWLAHWSPGEVTVEHDGGRVIGRLRDFDDVCLVICPRVGEPSRYTPTPHAYELLIPRSAVRGIAGPARVPRDSNGYPVPPILGGRWCPACDSPVVGIHDADCPEG